MAGYFRQRSKAGHTMSRPPMHPEPDIAAFRRFYAEGGYCAPEQAYAHGGSVADDFNLYQSQYYARGGAVDDDKVTKASVDYSPGMGKTRCRNCTHYQGGSCEIVRGDIDPDYWCQEFERGYARGGSVLDDLNLYQSQYYAGGGAVSHLRNWLKVLAEGLDLPVGVRAPAEVVPKIIEDGRFKSQFETGQSRGYNDPDLRRNIEAKVFGLPENLPDEHRPIYGSLFNPELTSTMNSSMSYGPVMGVVNRRAKDRATFTLGDSLDERMKSFRFDQFNDMRPKADPSVLWPSLQEQSHRLKRDFNTIKPTADWSPANYRDFWENIGAPDFGYVEAQIHGGLPLDDINRWLIDSHRVDNDFTHQIADTSGIPVIRRRDYQEPWRIAFPGTGRLDDLGMTLTKDDLGYAFGGSVDPNAGQSGIGAYDDTVDGPQGYAGGGLINYLKRLAEPIKAWHGSPHTFDKFDASHIGSGEGAQVYGHGLYFAENPEVAKFYRDSLTTKPQDQVSRIIDWAKDDPSFYHRLVNDSRGLSNEMRSMQGLVQYADNPEVADNIRRLLHQPGWKTGAWESVEPFKNLDRIFGETPPGSLYEVALHEDPARFLSLDAPLKEQGRVGEAALSHPMLNHYLPEDSLSPNGVTSANATSHELTSYLANEGFPGIRYLDANSRHGMKSAANRTHNYVVFPGAEDMVEILNRYAMGGAVGDDE